MYINGAGCLSPQPTFGHPGFPEEAASVESNRLKAIEPNYKEFVPPEMVRRMGRIIKMGVAAAKSTLNEAGCTVPDAIITGTGLGCIEDTEKFLGTMIRNREEFLTPTAFIQSTHNTVSAQIALLTGCHGYNFTYVHRGFSFENAILDSLLQFQHERGSSILLGAADELTTNSFHIQERMGFWRRKPGDSLTMVDHPGKGTVAGEGAAFFLLGTEKKPTTYARLTDVETCFSPDALPEEQINVRDILDRNGLALSDIDLVLLGRNGDVRFDRIYDRMMASAFPSTPSGYFKHLCGEYMTASSFGLWVAANILKEQRIPKILHVNNPPDPVKHILVYNHYRGINHSLILLSQA